MLVRNWMSEPVITLEEDEPIIKAFQILKEFKIRRIPITKNGKLTGIVTNTDIKTATPPKFAPVEIQEFYQLFSELPLKEIMTKDPITVYPEDSIEKAAILMLENKISGLPVINKDKYVVGIITQTDIFKLYVNISGAYYSPFQITLFINSTDDLPEILKIFNDLNIVIYSVLSWKDELCYEDECKRKLFIRFNGADEIAVKKLKDILESKYQIISFKKEDISDLPRKKITEDIEEIFIF
jgi:acetoin utilization protein AcuB